MGLRDFLVRTLRGLPPEAVVQLSERRDGLIHWQHEIARLRALARCLDESSAERCEVQATESESELAYEAEMFELERRRLLIRGYAVRHLVLPDPPQVDDFVAQAEQRMAEEELDNYLSQRPPRLH